MRHGGIVGATSGRFEICSTWDGIPVGPDERAEVEWSISSRLEIRVAAAFHDDPAPSSDPGPVDRLWEFEVVELFLLGADDHYLEVELGPHGHHLGLRLEGERNVVESGIPIHFEVERNATSWRGLATLALAAVPSGLRAANAYALHGVGRARRYLAAHPVPGVRPDFHRLAAFPAISPARPE